MPVLHHPTVDVPLPVDVVLHPGHLHARWVEAAQQKGFDLVARVKNRYHLALRCRRCGVVSVTKLFVLMNNRPICRACLETARAERAAVAGLSYLGPDPDHLQYGRYRAACGHVLRRQFEIIDRVAGGQTGLRCEPCFVQKEQRIAAQQGWTRNGPDPRGDPNYHLYRHNACGHAQRIARANLQWGQCDCAECGETWTAKPSFIYLFAIRHDGVNLLKLGYSANPLRRKKHQLGLPPGAEVTLLRSIAMPTGHAACAIEKRLHARLRRQHPEAVVPPDNYRGVLNVVSEVYRPWLQPELERRLDRIAEAVRDGKAPGAGRAAAIGDEDGGGSKGRGEHEAGC